MSLSKEQIKKILDEAPVGATDWCVHIEGDYGSEYGFDGFTVAGATCWFNEEEWNQIPLSDLRKQLGEAEWKNGLPPIGVECWFNFKVTHSQKCTPKYFGSDIVVYTNDKGREYSLLLSEVSFSKIETEAEELEREKLESAYDLYCEFTNSNKEDATCMSMYRFEASPVKFKWLAIVDKTKYRKEVE